MSNGHQKYLISGGQPLQGTVEVAGNKNAVLPIMAATLLNSGANVITNAPIIDDVSTIAEIIVDLGGSVSGLGTNQLTIDTANVHRFELNAGLVKKLRSSILFLGPLLARFGKIKMRHPGGCLIGRRAIDTHLQAIKDLGGLVKQRGDEYQISLKRFTGQRIFLDEVSVTATENALILAAAFPQETIIENAACEPHVRNLAEFLSNQGASITGAGTNRLVVRGAAKLKEAKIKIIPDYIEVGTFAIAAAATGGKVLIKDVIPQDLDSILLFLKRFNVAYELIGRDLQIKKSSLKVLPGKFQTRPYPGFPTDLLSPLIVLATQARGVALCHDWMYESRIFFTDKLKAMGADIILCDPHRVLVNGPTRLRGKTLESPDIRAGVALIIAALTARGQSVIGNIELVDRGYERLEERLTKLGASIQRIG